MRLSNITTTLAIILVIIVLGIYYRADNTEGVPEGETGLQVGVPVSHALPAGYDTIPLPVVLQLLNRTDSEAKLHAAGPCRIFRFVITTHDGEFVQAKRYGEECTQQPVAHNLAAGETLEEIQQVPLDVRRYRAGKYVVRVKFWNYEGSAEINLTTSN